MMVVHELLNTKQEHGAFSPAEECDLLEKNNELGRFAISGPVDEITQETLRDIKAFLQFIQEQKKICMSSFLSDWRSR